MNRILSRPLAKSVRRSAAAAASIVTTASSESPYALPQSLMSPLEARVGYKFRNSLLLAEAMTHPSLSLERRDYPFDNQRLEFLGDSVIQMALTEHLFRLFPEANEGEMTKMRTCLVSRRALRDLALSLDLGRYLMMGRGEEANGGRGRDSNLADAFEALIGAIYLDGGFEAARRFLLTEAESALATIEQAPSMINPKGRLQECLQALSPGAPSYELLGESGPEHSKQFLCRVVWQGQELAQGVGQSKKEAEVAAAKLALAEKVWEKSAPANRPSAGEQVTAAVHLS